jgi:hypothetical protein
MRWKNKQPNLDPLPGDKRSRKVFAWKPVKINNHTVWLERYGIDEVVVTTSDKKLYWLEINRYLLEYYY